jgi:hypothetical protein
MNIRTITIWALLMCLLIPSYSRQYFDKSKDLLLANFDLKPDEDDVHAAAALASMLQHPDLAGVNYYAVAGAYGIQGGTFITTAVPGFYNSLFGAENQKWTNAHANWSASSARARDKVKPILDAGGKVFVQEAGQSDFTYDLLQAVMNAGVTLATVQSRVIVVQHSQWNEDQATQWKLTWVKNNTDYNRIADGNGNNATPQYNTGNTTWMNQAKAASNPNTAAKSFWTQADNICSNWTASWENPAIAGGGVDYSDCVEIWWIFDIGAAADNISKFWSRYVTNTPSGGGAETVSCSSLPSSVQSSTSISVNVPYSANQSRDVVVEFWNSGWLGQATTTVPAGSGTANLTINLSSAPAAGSNYTFKVSIRPVGGNWTTNINSCQINSVAVTSGGGPETVSCNSLPSTIQSSTTVAVNVPYSVNQSRDLVVEFWDSGWIAQSTTTLSAGSGTAAVSIALPSAPSAGSNYTIKTSIRPVGGNWTTSIDFCQKTNITVTTSSGPETVSCSALPGSIPSSTSISVNVPYSANQSRDVVVEFWNNGWLGQNSTTVNAGSGTATVNISLSSAPAPGSNYTFKTSIRPVGGNWTTNINSCQVNGVTVTSSGARLSDGIETLNAESAFTVKAYPVPLSIADHLNVALTLPDPTNVNVQLTSIDGREVYSNTIINEDGTDLIFELASPELERLEKGIYLLKISAGEYSDILRVVR